MTDTSSEKPESEFRMQFAAAKDGYVAIELTDQNDLNDLRTLARDVITGSQEIGLDLSTYGDVEPEAAAALEEELGSAEIKGNLLFLSEGGVSSLFGICSYATATPKCRETVTSLSPDRFEQIDHDVGQVFHRTFDLPDDYGL